MGHSLVSGDAMIPLIHHHEKLNGAGYPHGLSGNAIHPFGRITALVDIYDALTTRRCYKPSLSAYDALLIISRNLDDYDRNIFNLLVGLIGQQEVTTRGRR